MKFTLAHTDSQTKARAGVIQTDQGTIETPIFMEPYVERFNNNLAGWAAEISVEVQSPFNLCDAAFE